MKFEKGNALFLILIAVALFAALSYAVTNSGRAGSGADRETALLDAAQLRNYSAQLQTAVNRLRLIGGGSPEEISFQHDASGDGVVSDSSNDFYNPNTPTGCHVFRPEGGGVTPPDIGFLSEYRIPTSSIYMYNFQTLKFELGAAEKTELVFRIAYLNEDFCEALGGRLFSATAPIEPYTFLGDFDDSNTTTGGGTTIYISSDKTEGCIKRSSEERYYYFNVLLVR